MWSKKDAERNFSILNASRGVFSVVEKISAGGRVYCMTATGEINKRLWVGTAVSSEEPYVEDRLVGKCDNYVMCSLAL